jgi:hypothetical protein
MREILPAPRVCRLARVVRTLVVLLSLGVAREARADDGPITALKNMLNASPTITLVSTGVVVLADGTFTVLSGLAAVQDRELEKGVYVGQTVLAAPQALGFSMAPFFFDIVKWKPVENILLLLPAQIWSSALTTHGMWSSLSTAVEPLPRFGVSAMIGANWAFTANAIGCLYWTRWSPIEIGIPQAILMSAEFGLSIERMVNDPEHRGEWAGLLAWSALMSAHGVASITDGIISNRPGSYPSGALPVVPFVAPTYAGLVLGASGQF